jgi:hypothetical protein
MLLKKFELIKNILFFKKKLWISEFDQLKLEIIKNIHDQSSSKHSEMWCIYVYIKKWYCWSALKQSVKRYVKIFISADVLKR